MSIEQWTIELFVNHWLMTTIMLPPLAFAYAWIKGHTAWWICTLIYMGVMVVFRLV